MNIGTRWKIAYSLDRLKRFCWCDLVDYVLSWRDSSDVEERQRLFRSTKDDTGWITRFPLLDILRRERVASSDRCQKDAGENGSCYCGKFATKEVRDQTSMCPKFIVAGTTRKARLERDEPTTRTDGFLSA